MEKNKRFFALIVVIFLFVLSVVPCFATSSFTDDDYYTPKGSVSISVTPFQPISTPSTYYEVLNIPITYTQGYTHTDVEQSITNTYLNSIYSVNTFVDNSNTDIVDKSVYKLCYQSSSVRINDSRYYAKHLVTVTLRDFYLGLDDVDGISHPEHINQSILGSIISGSGGYFYIPDRLTEYDVLKIRYRRSGDSLYSTAEIPLSDVFGGLIPYFSDRTSQNGVIEIKLDDFDNFPFFEEDGLYHIEELSLPFIFYDPYSMGHCTFNATLQYVDVRGIDNAMITTDLSSVRLPLKDFTSWLGEATTGFFTAEIAPGFPIGGIVIMVVAFAVVIWFLKMFAGG